MQRNRFRSIWLVLIAILTSATQAEEAKWRKHVINDRSPFEAAGAADFNGDGKVDVFSGDSWYEAPDWKRHRVRELPASPNPHYEQDFADLPYDVNGDGKMDIITCAYFNKTIGWVQQPEDATKPWIEHTVDKPGSMETAQLFDVNGDGQLDFLPNVIGTASWYEVADTTEGTAWKKHELGKEGSGHGIGVGDINADGRMDIIVPRGWYEQPADSSTKWNYHADFDFGAASILIIGRDFDGDGDTDILWGMGHDFGLFWLRQEKDSDGSPKWVKDRVDTTFSQVHMLQLADLDGDKRPEIVTGKRVYAHESEPGATDAPCIYAYQYDLKKKQWAKQVIYEGKPAADAPANAKDRWALKDFERGSAGTGLQIDAKDMDGDGDIDLVCPGKSGLYWFENLR